MKIIADRAETRSGVPALLESRGAAVVVAELDSGDYLLCEEGGVAVERKAASDFVLSIMDQRLFGQVAKMEAAYTRFSMIIEGDLFSVPSELRRESIVGALSWLSVGLGVPLHHTSDPEATAELLMTMARHAQDGLGYEIALRGGKPKAAGAIAQYLVEGLPGVGAKGAQNLLDHFGSARRVFAATPEELQAVPRVGKKAAERICSALDTIDERRRP